MNENKENIEPNTSDLVALFPEETDFVYDNPVRKDNSSKKKTGSPKPKVLKVKKELSPIPKGESFAKHILYIQRWTSNRTAYYRCSKYKKQIICDAKLKLVMSKNLDRSLDKS